MSAANKKLCLGLLAHVDAGKTTLSERILYECSAIRHLGRVDHRDAFLDSHPIERERGITVFSGLAHFQLGDFDISLMDTPGHVDFSGEMERSVQVMDLALLLVSAADGIQSHTENVWQLLKEYHVPTALVISKIDREGTDIPALMDTLKKELSPDCVFFGDFQQSGSFDDTLTEEIAGRDEALMERYFSGDAAESDILSAAKAQLSSRTLFPVFAVSALGGIGVDGLLRAVSTLATSAYHEQVNTPLAARVCRVRHDKKDTRLCFLKIEKGVLRAKDEITVGETAVKVNEMRIYHGETFTQVSDAKAGDIVALVGAEGLKNGQVIGGAKPGHMHMAPMLITDLVWDEKQLPQFQLSRALHILEDEEPTLQVEEVGKRLSIRAMGEVQLEILTQLLKERFGMSVAFGPCRVLYKETIAAPAIGIGHYEPLRHYAEGHFRLVPTQRGSGITFKSYAHVDDFALNWQRLIETHVFERTHKGVLTGSELTDVRVELLCGRDHLKHTEGGDFRQVTYRAIRNALMHAQSVLLEPICRFEMRFPEESYGTIAGELSRLMTENTEETRENGRVSVTGECPFALFSPWQTRYTMLTHGRGTLRVNLSRYAPCHNAQEVIDRMAYNPQADETADSVFCAHGAGYNVAWDKVKDFAHLPQEYPEIEE